MPHALQKQSRFRVPSPLATANSKAEKERLVLRTISPIHDLIYLYNWLEEPQLHANWDPRKKNRRLLDHYKLFLESGHRQSFLIEKWNRPLFQFDILLIQLHELHFRIPTMEGDCVFHYMILFRDEDIPDLKASLRLQFDYFYSFPECTRVWIPIPNHHTSLIQFFTELGCGCKSSYTSRQQKYDLFFLKRDDYMLATGGDN